MAVFSEYTFPSNDGTHQIACYRWAPEGAPRAVVQIVHGVVEHMGRYGAFARFLADRGYLVVGGDHLGHGKTVTDGKYGHLAHRDGWMLATADVHALRERTGEEFPGLPYFLFGHSMGSFLTRTYLGAYNDQFKPNRTTADWISRDEKAVDLYLADPFCTFKPTAGLFRDMMEGLQFISNKKNLAKMDPNTPVYLFSGDNDPVGSNGRGVEKVCGYFRAAGTKDLTMKLYPGGRHEMLNETNKDEVFNHVLAWLEAHLPAGRPA